MTTCKKCGNTSLQKHKFCPWCGTPLDKDAKK